MKLIKPYTEVLTDINAVKILKNIERIGRTAYKSEDKITDNSYKKFIKMLIDRNHLSVIEHESISVKFVVDRGISHELVRHRIASFTQESTRYCNYGNSEHITFIIPNWIDIKEQTINYDKEYILHWNRFEDAMVTYIENIADDKYLETLNWLYVLAVSETSYNENIRDNNWTPQQARSMLPNSLKTEVVVTANLREWRTIFKLRVNKSAHPQMREVMIPLLNNLKQELPIIFDDINI